MNARYGWKKFIIVVPSVAIREGVLNTIELTKGHFQSLYGNAPLDYWVYDSAQVSKLRLFSASNQMQLMVMKIQAFDKSGTVIQNTKDQTSVATLSGSPNRDPRRVRSTSPLPARSGEIKVRGASDCILTA